jgi:hypothetical protein
MPSSAAKAAPGVLSRQKKGRWNSIQWPFQNPASFHLERNLVLQFAPAGPQSGGFQNVSERWIVIQREQKLDCYPARAKV